MCCAKFSLQSDHSCGFALKKWGLASFPNLYAPRVAFSLLDSLCAPFSTYAHCHFYAFLATTCRPGLSSHHASSHWAGTQIARVKTPPSSHSPFDARHCATATASYATFYYKEGWNPFVSAPIDSPLLSLPLSSLHSASF